MDLSPELPQPIQYALEQGRTVLTANQRAARTLRRAFDLQQRALGRTSWQPPPILAWDSWLAGLWRQLLLEGHASELLLNATQEHTIWRDLIAADTATSSLRPVDSLAETAASAWLVLHAYRGRRRLRDYSGNSDTQVFARWATEFERRCTRAQYLSQAQLPESIRAAIAASHIAIAPGLLLVGFDSRTPAQEALFEAIRTTGAPVDEYRFDSPSFLPPESRRMYEVHALTEYDELTACARWLRTTLTARPDSRLAVIVPALETVRPEIDRTFRHVLARELDDIAAPPATGPYEFSLGVPLASTPMAAAALDILRWTIAAQPLDRISALLLSPYFAADGSPDSQHIARAEFDAFVLHDQHLLQPHMSLDRLSSFVSRNAASLPILQSHLQSLSRLSRRKDPASNRTHADWAAAIHEILEAAAWAVPAHLDSVEFQTRRKWEAALDELATLDFDNVRIEFPAALDALERIATETLFAPESRHAPIQIMGPLEAAGSTFDAIWFLRANDIAWPANPAPNPLLPWQLQRDLAMPGADAAVDTALARRITERIAASAPVVLFSYARESADGPQRRSPMLSGLDLAPRTTDEIAPAEPAPAPVVTECIADTAPVPAPLDRVLSGGASILKSQAECGFKAFAEKRLFSSALDSPSLGLDPAERGSIVHDALEKFWSEVKTHAKLTNLTPVERVSILSDSIDAALAAHTPNLEPGWPRAYFDGERQRLRKLLGLWLDYELRRSPFEVKLREEALDDVQIGPLHIKIRIDRVDTSLVDGEPAGEILLDYKTGLSKPADWLGDRPDEPQLPLYVVVSGITDLAAVAFANIRPGKQMGLDGYQARNGVLPKATKPKTDSLDAQVDQWRRVLTSLAGAYHSGDARVAPKQYPSTCRYCQQRLLCRLDLTTLDPNANEDFIDEKDPAADTTDSTAEAELG